MDGTHSAIPSPPNWTCDACYDEHDDYCYVEIDGDTVCKPCIQSVFNKALEHVINYPPKWGSTILHPKHFHHIISEEFIAKYAQREKEYQSTPCDRLYCHHEPVTSTPDSKACGTFVRTKREEDENTYAIASCTSCGIMMCLKCGCALSDIESTVDHTCEGRRLLLEEIAEELEKDAFEGLQQVGTGSSAPSRVARGALS